MADRIHNINLGYIPAMMAVMVMTKYIKNKSFIYYFLKTKSIALRAIICSFKSDSNSMGISIYEPVAPFRDLKPTLNVLADTLRSEGTTTNNLYLRLVILFLFSLTGREWGYLIKHIQCVCIFIPLL